MGFFHQPKPRHFHHEPIYFDEHKDRVKQIEKRARQELKVKESHGFGLMNVRSTVEACDGILKVSSEENTFVLSIMLPRPL